MDLFLKFENEEEAIKVLFDIIPAEKNEAGEVVKQQEIRQKFRNTDIIGVIYKQTGEFEEVKDGEPPLPKVEALPGWHVNVRSESNENVSDLIKYSIKPTNPIRVWA